VYNQDGILASPHIVRLATPCCLLLVYITVQFVGPSSTAQQSTCSVAQ
jgi:hypothetical protein